MLLNVMLLCKNFVITTELYSLVEFTLDDVKAVVKEDQLDNNDGKRIKIGETVSAWWSKNTQRYEVTVVDISGECIQSELKLIEHVSGCVHVYLCGTPWSSFFTFLCKLYNILTVDRVQQQKIPKFISL